MDVIPTLLKVTAILNLLVFLVGVITNFITLLVCLRKRLRSVPTFIFIAFTAVIDVPPVANRNLDFFIYTYFGFYTRFTYELICKWNQFWHFFPLFSSAWLLVALTIERYLSVKIPLWRKKIFTSTHAAITSTIIILFFASVHVYVNFSPVYTSKVVRVNNASVIQTSCSDGFLAATWSTVSFLHHFFIVSIFLYF